MRFPVTVAGCCREHPDTASDVNESVADCRFRRLRAPARWRHLHLCTSLCEGACDTRSSAQYQGAQDSGNQMQGHSGGACCCTFSMSSADRASSPELCTSRSIQAPSVLHHYPAAGSYSTAHLRGCRVRGTWLRHAALCHVPILTAACMTTSCAVTC